MFPYKLTTMRELFKAFGGRDAESNGSKFDSLSGHFFYGLEDMCNEMVEQLSEIE